MKVTAAIATFVLVILIAVSPPAQATVATVTGNCDGWTVTNLEVQDLEIIVSSDPAVSGTIVAGGSMLFPSPFDGTNDTLDLTVRFVDGVVTSTSTPRSTDCEVPPSNTTTTTIPPSTTIPPEPTTTTSEPPGTTSTTSVTTSTTTTTEPPTTTTVTTPPPSTTSTTEPPTTSTTPPSSSTTTTSSTTTSTTVPPTIDIQIEIVCDGTDAITGAREPIQTIWAGTYTPDSTDQFEVFIEVRQDNGEGEIIGSIDVYGLSTPGFHDNWFGPDTPIDGVIYAAVWIDGVLHVEDTTDCGGPTETTLPPTTVTTQPPVCDENSPSWIAETETCELPFTGMNLAQISLVGLGLLGLAGVLLAVDRKERNG